MMAIKRMGRSFLITDLFKHAVSIDSRGLIGHIEYDTISQIDGKSLEPRNLPQNVIEIGKTHRHFESDYSAPLASDDQEVVRREYYRGHERVTIYGRILPGRRVRK